MTRAKLDSFFAEQHERLNVDKAFDHFMGRVDPYKDVKDAVDQLDRHFNDVYKNRYIRRSIHFMYLEEQPDPTPAPDLEEVIINVALNPNLKQKTNEKR